MTTNPPVSFFEKRLDAMAQEIAAVDNRAFFQTMNRFRLEMIASFSAALSCSPETADFLATSLLSEIIVREGALSNHKKGNRNGR